MLDLIGNTPLVRLKRTSEIHGITCVLAMKMETTNPGGSSKDRPALEMILAAERDGLLQPGGTIVEPTSGNTGVGLAIVAAQRGYKCVFVMTDKNGPEKVQLLRGYGAEVIVCPVAVPPEDPQSYYKVAERVTAERNAFRPNQYANPNNPLAHELTTGPELWSQTGGRITHFVAGAGTCGTITGTARYLKQQNPNIKIIAADPEMSVFSGGSGRPYLVEGVGEDFFPAAWDAIALRRDHRGQRRGELPDCPPGQSRGRHPDRRQRWNGGRRGVAGGEARRSRRHRGRAEPRHRPRLPVARSSTTTGWPTSGSCRSATSASLRCSTLAATRRRCCTSTRPRPVRQTIEVMRANGVSQLPVCKNTPPFANAEVSGSVDELDLMESVYRDPSVMDTAVEKVMSPKLPTIGVGQKVALAVQMLDKSPALLVLVGRSAAERADPHRPADVLRGRGADG